MRLISVEFDSDEQPSEFAFALALNEVALLYRLTGHVAPLTITEAFGGDQRWGEANDEIAECVGNALNRFFDDGANDVIPKPSRVLIPPLPPDTESET